VKPARVALIASAFSPRDFPRGATPEIVLAGRSNVGKSSLINRLTGIRGLAHTSAAPGKTRGINFYRCQESFFLVDLPGFGYAEGRGGSREWKGLVESYFADRPSVALVLHLVDARMPPTALDLQFAEWLGSLGIPRLVVATKADKLSGNRKAVQQRVMNEIFAETQVIFSSAVTGVGCREIWSRVAEAARNR